MLNDKLSEQLSQSILDNKMTLEHLKGFLKNYPDIAVFLNNNYFKIPFVYSNSPLVPVGHYVIAPDNHPKFGLINKQFSRHQEQVFIEIPCVHYILFQFKSNYQELVDLFNIEPFKMSYLHMKDKKYLLLGFNLYTLLGLKIDDKNFSQFPLLANNKEEFMNFYYEKKNNNNYISVYCDSLFPLFDFKLNINDLLYNNDKMALEERNLIIYFFDKEIRCLFKNLNEFSHHERIPLDNLIEYKVDNEQIDFDFDANGFFDFLVLKNYFIKNSASYPFCLTLLKNNPTLFTPEIMALLCLKNFDLHELLIKNYPENHYLIQHSEANFNLSNHKENLMMNYSSVSQETQSIIDKLLPNEENVKMGFNELQLHINVILQENGIAFLSENIEERITFENIISKYIPSILNNYLSIPAHLRNKKDSQFVSMTLDQFSNIQKELEKIELAIISEDVKKMKVFGKFLDNRLGNNSKDIISLS